MKTHNPLVPKSAKFKIEGKILNFILQNCQKQTAPLETDVDLGMDYGEFQSPGSGSFVINCPSMLCHGFCPKRAGRFLQFTNQIPCFNKTIAEDAGPDRSVRFRESSVYTPFYRYGYAHAPKLFRLIQNR